LNTIRFRAYTFITLIFIGSPIQANGKRRDLPIAFTPGAVCLIEWPERVAGRLPGPDLALTVAYPADPSAPGRELTLSAHTEVGERCLAAVIAVDPG
jgi:tRNA A37 threonylcarbamoyladenosine biosynthesis protein TsaE